MKLAKKQGGFVITSELIILATVIAIGSIIGFSIMRNALVAELLDIADAIEAKQQYAFDGTKRSPLIINNNGSDGLIWVSFKKEKKEK